MIKPFMHYLVRAIIEQLEQELSTAANASQQAHASATHSENIADNKYDTLAVEAAYLAHGQSMRIAELQQAIALYQQFKRPQFSAQSSIQLGALVCIEDDQGQQRHLLLGPAAGGLSLNRNGDIISLITPATPLGQALMGQTLDDEVLLQLNQQQQRFTIVSIE
ncbi:hypothetical protein BST96_14075 [Oceanicoccus sagamiensis]|uniref:Transcription elongation factor GreA/GreB C-terminal domain-containing protein n=1 Tax=Oceanicoccus sagamiensis TaxID=716816 RepID=A0A1X9NEG4_9GAMM|nr:hypothetical protein BST96_14075 [Oceanicoccus sagamiensis]